MDDILGVIFLQLPIRSILDGRTINKRYKYAIDKLWYRLCKRDYFNFEILEETYYETYKTTYILRKLVDDLKLNKNTNLQLLNEIKSLNSSSACIKSFPQRILSLKQLKILNLDFNRIDIIPSAVLSELNHLEELSLECNDIKSIPKEIQLMTSLKILNLSCNYLKKIKIWNMTNLKELDISGNQIKKISGLNNLINLERIKASSNLIEKIPEINLKKLIHVDLSVNCIKDIPECFASLPLLETVYLTNNYIKTAPNFHFRLFIHPERFGNL